MKKILMTILIVLVLSLSACINSTGDVDNEAPKITINEYEESFYLGGDIPLISATCEDDVDETCYVTTPNYPDLSVAGEHTVTFRATDKAGNISTKEVTITAIDRSVYITLNIGSYEPNVELGAIYNLPLITCTSTASPTCIVTMPTILDTSVANSKNSITVTGTDDQENSKTVVLSIPIIDTVDPVITLTGSTNINIELGDDWTDPFATATDLSGTPEITTDITPDLNTVGVYTITYTAQDLSGNEDEVSRTVNVVDTTNPTITLEGDANVTIELGSTWTDPGVTTTDLQTVTVTQDIIPDSNAVGQYIVIYTAEDASGNTATVTRTVNVVDTTDPEITLVGDAVVNVTVGASWTDPGVTTTDLQTVTVTQDVTPDLNTTGVYVITYTAEDASGNTATVQRTVNVN